MNLRFTVDAFDNDVIIFLIVKFWKRMKPIFIWKKPILEFMFNITAWVGSLFDSAQKICSNQQLLMTKLNYLKRIMSRNRYPHYINTKIVNQLQSSQKAQRNSNDQDKENLAIIFCRIPYAGAQDDRLLKKLTRKLKWIISKPFNLKTVYKTNKMGYFCKKKNRITDRLKSHVV